MNKASNQAYAGGRLLTPSQAAEFTGLSNQTLANMRSTGRGPAYFKVGKYVRYDETDGSRGRIPWASFE